MDRDQILLVGTFRPTVGGISAVLEDHFAEFRRRGLRVEAFNTGRQIRGRPGRANLANASAALTDALRLWRVVRRLRPRITVVHTTGHPILPVLRAAALAAAARAAGSVCVVHLHAQELSTRHRGMARGYRLLLRLSSGVVVLDEEAAAQILAWTPTASVAVIRNGVDTDRFTPGKASESGLRLVFVGTVGQRKGVADLLAAMRRLPEDVTCDVVGGGAEEGAPTFAEIFADAADLRAADRVTMHGELDREATIEVLHAASAFVLPSRAEGMPMALLEAMSCGLPVLVTDVGSMGQIVRDAHCGMVVSAGDVDGLLEQVGVLRDDRAMREGLGAAARAAAVSRFAIGECIDQTLAFYRRVVPEVEAANA